MKIILIILAIIGLLKLVSLFILCIVEIYCRIKDISIIGIKRVHGIYKDSYFYIIPTIRISYINNYFECTFNWLWFQYYCCYSIDEDES